MDKFVENTGGGSCADKTIVMDYYDGNTRHRRCGTYAQHFAMSDRHFGSTFGPSTIGAINVVSGNTHGVSRSALGRGRDDDRQLPARARRLLGRQGRGPGDDERPQHRRPDERRRRDLGLVRGRLQADVLAGQRRRGLRRHAGERRRRASSATTSRTTSRSSTTPRRPTAHHVPPSSVATIGTTDEANHQYDLTDFDTALAAGNLPQVSFLKAVSRRGRAPGLLRPARRAALRRARAQRAPAVAGVGLDRGVPRLRRLRRLVRPRLPRRRSRARDGPSDALNGVGKCGPAPGRRRLPRPLRPRPAPAAGARLAVGEAELRRLHADRAGVDHALHRGQLEPRADRRPVVRRARRRR